MEYQALIELAQMHMLQKLMQMFLRTTMLFLAMTLGCIAGLCAFALRQPRPSRSRQRETPEEKDIAIAAWRFSTR